MSDTWGEPAVSPPPPLSSMTHAPPGVHAKIRIGSQVLGQEGEEIGTVEKVVISPKSCQVTHLLIHRGPLPLLHHDVIMPVDAIRGVSEAVVQLNVPVSSLNRTAAHDAADYVSPAAAWEPPGEYERDQALFALPRSTSHLDQLLSRNEGRTANTQFKPEGVLIDTGTKVEANDGPIGSIDRVLLDPDTGRVTHFVVRKGPFLAKHVIIPVDWATEITPEKIRLAVDREQLAVLPEYRSDDEIARDPGEHGQDCDRAIADNGQHFTSLPGCSHAPRELATIVVLRPARSGWQSLDQWRADRSGGDSGSPAEQAGLQPGDVILAVDDTSVEGTHLLVNILLIRKPGDAVQLHIVRDGKAFTLKATLGAGPSSPDNVSTP